MPAARRRAAGIVVLLSAVGLLAACEDGTIATADPTRSLAGDTSYRSRPGYIVDSIHPPEELLRRFREGLAPTGELTGGESSREALVARFSAAVAIRDTAALRALVISRREFAYLLYPESPYVRPPYRTAPGVIWMQLTQASSKGLTRLLRDDFVLDTIVAHRCDLAPEREGANTLWRGCSVTARLADGRPLVGSLFGVIVERDGQFKFASLATDF